jgi:uncharacterized protein (TIGR00369 family)
VAFDKDAAERLLAQVFAAWVQALDLSVEEIGADGAILRMRFSERLCRDNGGVCGQAIASLADTAMVFAVSAASGGYRPMTTVDQTVHFLRPIANADALAVARVLRLGRSRPGDDRRRGRRAAGRDGADGLRAPGRLSSKAARLHRIATKLPHRSGIESPGGSIDP